MGGRPTAVHAYDEAPEVPQSAGQPLDESHGVRPRRPVPLHRGARTPRGGHARPHGRVLRAAGPAVRQRRAAATARQRRPRHSRDVDRADRETLMSVLLLGGHGQVALLLPPTLLPRAHEVTPAPPTPPRWRVARPPAATRQADGREEKA